MVRHFKETVIGPSWSRSCSRLYVQSTGAASPSRRLPTQFRFRKYLAPMELNHDGLPGMKIYVDGFRG